MNDKFTRYGRYTSRSGRWKKCTKCEKVQKHTAFYKNKSAADGLCNWCIACQKERRYRIRHSKPQTMEAKVAIDNQPQQDASELGMTKLCKKCGETKPRHAFARDRTSKDGLQYYCSDCRRSASKLTKVCPHCHITKLVSEFSTNSSKSDGLQSWCRECMKEAQNKPPSPRREERRRVQEQLKNQNGQPLPAIVDRGDTKPVLIDGVSLHTQNVTQNTVFKLPDDRGSLIFEDHDGTCFKAACIEDLLGDFKFIMMLLPDMLSDRASRLTYHEKLLLFKWWCKHTICQDM